MNKIKLQPSKNINHFGPLFVGLFKDFGYPFWHTMLQWTNVIKIKPDNRYWQVWLIKNNKELTGVCGLYSLNNKKKQLWLGWFGILPELRSSGIGEQVIKSLERKAKKEGCTTIYSYVGRNNYKALKFYKRLGFKRVCNVREYIKANKISQDEFESMSDHIIKKEL